MLLMSPPAHGQHGVLASVLTGFQQVWVSAQSLTQSARTSTEGSGCALHQNGTNAVVCAERYQGIVLGFHHVCIAFSLQLTLRPDADGLHGVIIAEGRQAFHPLTSR